MMEGILGNRDNVVKILFFLNLVFFVFSLFVVARWFSVTMVVVNIIMTGSFMVLKKYHYMIQGVVMGNKMLKQINVGLNNMGNGQVSR